MEVKKNKKISPNKHYKIAKCPICKNKSIIEYSHFVQKNVVMWI